MNTVTDDCWLIHTAAMAIWPYHVGYYFQSLSQSKAITPIPCPVDRDDNVPLTPSLRRPCIHAIFFRPHVGQGVNTHSVFWELGRKPCQHATRGCDKCWMTCQHATRGCDKCWMTCIHAGVSRSPREHRQFFGQFFSAMSSLVLYTK